MRILMSSKIHKATVTQADLNYVGSITIDEDLMDMVDLVENEKVLVVSNTSGSRLETYVIKGPRGSGVICMNGAAAHLVKQGEEIIIIAFRLSDTPIQPKAILCPGAQAVSFTPQDNRFLGRDDHLGGTDMKLVAFALVVPLCQGRVGRREKQGGGK